MDLRYKLRRYKFNAKIISDDPKLNVPHTHPLYTFSIYACVCVGKLSPRFSYFQLFSTEILAEHDRGNTSVARSQTGCRKQAFLSGLYRWMQARQRNIEGEGRTGVCIGERITDSLLERVGDGGRRKREGGARSSKRGTIDRYSSNQRGVPRI